VHTLEFWFGSAKNIAGTSKLTQLGRAWAAHCPTQPATAAAASSCHRVCTRQNTHRRSAAATAKPLHPPSVCMQAKDKNVGWSMAKAWRRATRKEAVQAFVTTCTRPIPHLAWIGGPPTRSKQETFLVQIRLTEFRPSNISTVRGIDLSRRAMTTKEYLTHWNHSRRGKVVINYDATGGVVALRVHLANESLVDRVRSKQHAKESLGLRSYTKRDDGRLRMKRFPNGKPPEGEGWEATETDEQFAAAQEKCTALVADNNIPTLPVGEWKCDGYSWYWREAGLEWDGKEIANVFVGCSPPTKSTIFSAGHGQQFDGNSVLVQRRKDEHGVVLCVCISGAMPTEKGWLKEIVVQCNTLEGRDIREYVSPLGNNDVPYHYAIDTAGEPTPGVLRGRARSTAVVFCHPCFTKERVASQNARTRGVACTRVARKHT